MPEETSSFYLHRIARKAEARVLDLSAEGFSYKEIAVELGLTRKTVCSHLQHVRERTGLSYQHIRAQWLREKVGLEIGLSLST